MARVAAERREQDRFRSAWFAARRTVIYFRRQTEEFETYVLGDNFGRKAFRIGSVRLTVDANRHHALRRLKGQTLQTANFMADTLEDLSDFLGQDDQQAVNGILGRLQEIQVPELYRDVIRLCREVADLYADLLGAVDAEGHLVISVAERMRDVAGQLERGEIAPADLDEVWEWWSTLVMAFVEAYEIEDVQKLAAVAPMGREDAQFPTLADMRYLQALQLWLDAYIGERPLLLPALIDVGFENRYSFPGRLGRTASMYSRRMGTSAWGMGTRRRLLPLPRT